MHNLRAVGWSPNAFKTYFRNQILIFKLNYGLEPPYRDLKYTSLKRSSKGGLKCK